MANRLTHELQHMGRQEKVISGIISIVGAASAGNNTVTKSKGLDGVASVARTGTGAMTVTLDDAWVECHGISADYQTAGARTCRITSHDVASAKTIVITTLDDALAAADVPNGSTDYIHLIAILKNSTVR